MSGNAQGLLQPQIFESLQKKIDEETEVRDVSTPGQIFNDLNELYTDPCLPCLSPSARLCKRLKSKVDIFLSFYSFLILTIPDRSTQAILSRAHSSSNNERQ
jgi:hypothetical protein